MLSLQVLMLLLLVVVLLASQASSRGIQSRDEHNKLQELDVRSVLESLNRQPERSIQPEQHDEADAGEEEVFQLVHRSSLQSRSTQSTSSSHQEQLKHRLERDAARVRSLGQRLEMALGGVRQSDLTVVDQLKRNGSDQIFRTSKASSENEVTSGLTYGSGEYFVRMGIGTPSKYMYLVMDTGSDVPWIQCTPCKSCYKQHDLIFDPTSSSTFKSIPCNSAQCRQLDIKSCSTSSNTCLYQVSYGDGSFTVGDLVSDTFSMKKTGSSFVFGCGHDNEGLFIGAAGLLGLGAGKLSFPTQLTSSGGYSTSKKRFSYCLVTRDNGVKASSALLFGDSAIPPSTSFSYTSLLKNPRLDTFYYAGLTGISVGGTLLGIPSGLFRLSASTGRGGVIIDSGTSVTRLPTSAYTAMRDAFRSGTSNLPKAPGFSLFDTCYDFSSKSSVSIPTVTFHFEGGARIQLPPGNYMVPVDNSGTFCFAFAKTSLDLSIIGNIQQQTMRVVFDLESSRIGFAPKQCT